MRVDLAVQHICIKSTTHVRHVAYVPYFNHRCWAILLQKLWSFWQREKITETATFVDMFDTFFDCLQLFSLKTFKKYLQGTLSVHERLSVESLYMYIWNAFSCVHVQTLVLCTVILSGFRMSISFIWPSGRNVYKNIPILQLQNMLLSLETLLGLWRTGALHVIVLSYVFWSSSSYCHSTLIYRVGAVFIHHIRCECVLEQPSLPRSTGKVFWTATTARKDKGELKFNIENNTQALRVVNGIWRNVKGIAKKVTRTLHWSDTAP